MKPRRFKLLLDENMSPRQRFPILNSRHDIKHIVQDLKKNGISDQEVYNLAIKSSRIIVTFNRRDFEKIAEKSRKAGIISVSTNVPDGQIDIKITALLSKMKKSNLFGVFHHIAL